MNKFINKFLLTGDKFMPELHLKQPGFTYSACGPFTKHYEIIQKFREAEHLKHLYRNELDKACFPHDTAHFDNKYFAKRTISDKIFKDRAYEDARNCKKTGSGISVNEQLAKELHKPVIKKNSKQEKPLQDLKTIFGHQI